MIRPDRCCLLGTPSLFLCVAAANAAVSFAPPVILDTPGATADFVLEDLDGDGDLDIASLEAEFAFAIGIAHGFVNVLLNDGAGGFSGPSTFDLGDFPPLEFAVDTLATGDFDGDGDVDLAAVGSTAPVTLLFNDGRGSFGDPVDTGITVNLGALQGLLDAGDLDGDGDVDLALGLPGQIATNDGSGVFEVTQFTDDTNPRNLEIVDLDNDGDEDIAFGFRVHLNDGAGNFTLLDGIFPGAGAIECAFADFDGDGDPDVACGMNFPGELRLAESNGDGTFGPFTVTHIAMAPGEVHTGSFDGDGDADLLVTHGGNDTGTITILAGHGDGTFDAAVLPSPPGAIAGVGDLDGDGLDDIVISTGSVFATSPIAVLVNTTVQNGVPGDLNDDGVIDAADLARLLGLWGSADVEADLNGDGAVDAGDLAILLGSWR